MRFSIIVSALSERTSSRCVLLRGRGQSCVPAGVVRRYCGRSGQRQSPLPGLCGQLYASQWQD
jgi:hypothetical protein